MPRAIRARIGLFAASLGVAAVCLAQGAIDIRFAVAPSKAKQPTATSVTPAYTGNQILFTGATLKNLAGYAFGWNETNIAGGPAWVNTARWDLVARAPSTLAPARFPQLVRDFLEARFALKSHKEMRSAPVYDLLVAGRHRLKPSTGRRSYSSLGRGRFTASRWTMAQLASVLERIPETGRPVRDRTGLSGEFDIDLNYASGLPAALEQQLGLKLVSATAPVEFLVIDAASQP